MKKLILMLSLSFLISMSFAQQDKFVFMMETSIDQMKAAETEADLQKITNVFERLSSAEKEEWLPAYYQALCNVKLAAKAMRSGENEKIEAFVDIAQAALDHCKTLVPDESEVHALQGYIYTSRIWADPMSGGAKFSPLAHIALAKAIELDANNPRAYFLRGQLVFYTPEFYGGGPKNAYKDLAKADELFNSFEKASSIHPEWGMEGNTYHLLEARKVMEDKKIGENNED